MGVVKNIVGGVAEKKAAKAKAPGRAKKTQPTEQLSLTPEPADE